jgi:hypothetical protein
LNGSKVTVRIISVESYPLTDSFGVISTESCLLTIDCIFNSLAKKLASTLNDNFLTTNISEFICDSSKIVEIRLAKIACGHGYRHEHGH